MVRGLQAQQWRSNLPATVLSAEQVEQSWDVLDDHVRKRDRADHAAGPVPLSIEALLLRLLGMIVAGIAGLLVTAQLLQALD